MLKSPKTTRSVGNNHSQLDFLSDSQYKSLLANQLNLKVDLEMRIVDTEERCRRKSTNEAKVVYLILPNAIPFVRPALSGKERWAASRATRGHSLLRHATPHAPPNILLYSLGLCCVLHFLPKQNGQQARPVWLLLLGAAAAGCLLRLHIIITRIQ